MKLLYALILAVLAVFYVMYADLFSFLLLLTFAAVPAVELILLMVSAKLTKISVVENTIFSRRGVPCRLQFEIRSSSFLPFVCADAELVCVNGYEMKPIRMKTEFHIAPHSCSRIDFSVCSMHCGAVYVRLRRVRIYDALRLFSITKKVPEDAIVMYVFPNVYELNPPMENNFEPSGDSEEYIPSKKGDDPSEIFALREWQAGDRVNRIHWKLSSKLDTYIVKELSENRRTTVLILTELMVRKGHVSEDMDELLDTAASAAAFLDDESIPYEMGMYRASTSDIFSVPITSEESSCIYYAELFRENVYFDKPFALMCCTEAHNAYSHVIYITADNGQLTAEYLSRLGAKGGLTTIHAGGISSQKLEK